MTSLSDGSVEFTVYEYVQIAKMKRHKSSLLIPEVLEAVGQNRCGFVSFF